MTGLNFDLVKTDRTEDSLGKALTKRSLGRLGVGGVRWGKVRQKGRQSVETLTHTLAI